MSAHDDRLYALRRKRSSEDLEAPLKRLYGDGAESLIARLDGAMAQAWANRPADLKDLDLQRDLEPDWFLRPDQLAYVIYADRFAGDLKGIIDHIPYLQELGVTYLHIMPCLKPRDGANDGGYSVQGYREINPALGTMDDFEAVCAALRSAGISPCIDLVLNHTAREHAWATAARAGDDTYQSYYRLFPDRTLPDRYEETLLEVFPDQAPGNFLWDEDLEQWVWTTFNTHQWDLNWETPDVFYEIADIMLVLANKGAEIFRLDAVAFMWKRLGTLSQNEPEVHDILQALRAVCRIVCPAVLHKAEAIVAPDKLLPYLGTGKHTGKVGNLAYHNSLMVQFWSSLAARDTRLMTEVLRRFPETHKNATWGTYLRCHDDIGWAINDEDAAAVGWSGHGHRQFLADFYEGGFDGSFASGGRFQFNPETGDRRTNGTTASLCGLERAQSPNEVQTALDRILLGHALIFAWGGIPLLYMGDELGVLNDHDWQATVDEDDTRWMHRPHMDWTKAKRRHDPLTTEGRLFAAMKHLAVTRSTAQALHGAIPRILLDPPAAGVLAFDRSGEGAHLRVRLNFTEHPQQIGETGHDLVSGRMFDGTLAPYQAVWLLA
jgi:amylosucrase